MTDYRLSRREFLASATAAGLGSLAVPDLARAAAAGVPTANPAAKLKIAWTDTLKWSEVVDVSEIAGRSWDERFAKAQAIVADGGGGVVYFPAGTYEFKEALQLKDGVIIRGADPRGSATAHDENYNPPTRFEFPKYKPSFSGSGTPIDTAFKGIYLENPAGGANCGLVNLYINHGHVHFDETEERRCGGNRLVFGCVVRAAAVAEPGVPDRSIGQKAWQRYTRWHYGAVEIKAAENILVANNRLPESSSDNFTMQGYVLRARRGGTVEYPVVFDYDNRPGLNVSHYCVGAPGGEEPSGTPDSHPWGFRRGIVIRDNYIYSTGKTAIAFSGDGTICANNVIRFKKDVWRQTNTGTKESSGSSTNDNRAVEMRGWRWTVEKNDYVVFRNYCADHKYYINDGEGLMHENHCNAHIRDSKLIGNRGNAYLSLYKTGAIDGLLIEDNDVTVDRGLAIFVESDHSPSHRGPCRNVTIANNTTAGGGILIRGEPASNNLVKGNRHIGEGGVIRNVARAKLESNRGYEVETA